MKTTLTWDLSPSKNPLFQNVYRKVNSKNPWVKRGEVNTKTTTWVDTNVYSGTTYYYYVTVVVQQGKNKVESAASNVVEV